MTDMVRLAITEDIEVSMPRDQAIALLQRLGQQLGLDSGVAVEGRVGGLVLADDHPLWDQHTGLEGHREWQEWSPSEDLARAEAFYGRVGGKAKVFLDLLIDHPGQQLDVDQICALAPDTFSSSRSIAGSLYGLYMPHNDSMRRYPFYWWEGKPTRYAMKASVAELLRRARANAS